MRIYTKLVYGASGQLLEEEFYEHDGDVALCKGSGGGEVKETAEEQALAKIAAEQWNEYQSRFVPMENKFIEGVQQTEDDYAYAEGVGAGRVQEEASDAAKTYRGMATKTGAQPGSGKGISMMSGLAAKTGKAGAEVVTDAHDAVDDLHNRGLMTAVQMGRGQAADAQLGLTEVASDASRKGIRDSYNRFTEGAANQQAVGQAAGIGLRAYEEKG